MANSLLNASDLLKGPAEPGSGPRDSRVFMYRDGEARIFASLRDVPPNEGWCDTPTPPKAKKQRVADGDG